MKLMKKTPKVSRAIREIVRAYQGLLPTEQDAVLRQLGLMKDPVAQAAAVERKREERDRVMASTASPNFDLSDFECAPGEQGVGLPHPDRMTPEEKAIWYPKRRDPKASRPSRT